jgi:transcriptional regulator with PAS, ATPase and Fis domain
MVSEGTFREDLLYRINTVELTVPPLYERTDDIPALAIYYTDKIPSEISKVYLKLPLTVVEQLQKYKWPGNIRELQHAIERAVIMSEGEELSIEDFGNVVSSHGDGFDFAHLNLEKLEAWAIRKAIAKHKGNISHAAGRTWFVERSTISKDRNIWYLRTSGFSSFFVSSS